MSHQSYTLHHSGMDINESQSFQKETNEHIKKDLSEEMSRVVYRRQT